MKKLLDVTDRETRLLQHFCVLGSQLLLVLGLLILFWELLPTAVAISVIVSAFVAFVFAASIKQRWEIEYRGHQVRFENSAVTAERLYLDDGLVARGGFGKKMELRAPIRVGEGAGEEIMALVDANILSFRLRIFVESNETEPERASPTPEYQASATEPAQIVNDLRTVNESTLFGNLAIAKQLLEVVAALISLIGGVSAAAAWLF